MPLDSQIPQDLPFQLPSQDNQDEQAAGVARRILKSPRYQFFTYHTVSRGPLLQAINFVNPSWTKTLDGNGSFTGDVIIPDDPRIISNMHVGFEPGEIAIYVKDVDTNNWVWGGPIVNWSWDPKSAKLTINAVEWRAWLSWKILGPYPAYPTPAASSPPNFKYSYSQKDQLLITKDLVAIACRGGYNDKVPTILIGNETSGAVPPIAAKRDLNFMGADFKKAADLIDSMAHRAGGFNWSLEVRTSPTDGWPILYLGLYYPEQGGVVPGLLFSKTNDFSNLIDYGPVVKDWSKVKQRIWAIGSTAQGANSPIYAQDTNPLVKGTPNVLMAEDTIQNTSVVNTSTLSANARAERLFLEPTFTALTVTVGLANPNRRLYDIGDRATIIIKDRFIDFHYYKTRITSITTTPQNGAGTATVLFDLNDRKPPDLDNGGLV